MRKAQFEDCGVPSLGKTLTEVGSHNLTVMAGPLARYMADAAHVFAGIDVVLGLVESSDLREETYNDGHDVERFLSPADRANMLALARTAAKLMRANAEHVSNWADKHISLPGPASRTTGKTGG